MCGYCNDTGIIETDNNGPIGDCPVCKPDKKPDQYWIDKIIESGGEEELPHRQ